MSKPITNISEANQRIGELNAELRIEKEARTAAQTDFETAKAVHAQEKKELQEANEAAVTQLKGAHATETTKLNDKVSALETENTQLKGEVAKLKGEADTADGKAAKIVAQTGGEAVGADEGGKPDVDPDATTEQLWAQYNAIESIADKREFYVTHIKPKSAK